MTFARVWRRALAMSFVVVWNAALAETQPVSVTASSPISAHFSAWEDPEGAADLQQVVALPDSQWQEVPTGSAIFGITPSAYWLRFAVENQTADTLRLIAELAYSQLDDVVFHVVANGEPVKEFRTGDTRAFYPRQVDHPNMLLRFDLQPEQVKTVYVWVETAGSMILPLNVWRENDFFGAAANEQKLHSSIMAASQSSSLSTWRYS